MLACSIRNMIQLLEKSSKLVSASVKSFSFIIGNQNEKKYFTLNKWRLAQVTADYSTKGKKYKST
jgi:hypothetical protein